MTDTRTRDDARARDDAFTEGTDPAEIVGVTAPTARPIPGPPPAAAAAPPRSRARRRGFLLLGLAVLAAAAVYLFSLLTAKPVEGTDDAYVGGNIVSVTARDGGTVLALHADNTQAVKRGQPLIDLDPATTDVALASAEAALGRAVRAVRANGAQVDEAGAEIAQAQAELSRAEDDYTRRSKAAKDGAVSGEEVAHARDAVTTAQAALTLARARQAQASSVVQGTDVSHNPQVLAAAADVRQAAINAGHTRIVAPLSGVVAQRTVQLGQRVAAGTPLMAVVPLDSLWVDANFRETQLQDLRVGQAAAIHADVYGKAVTFHGRVLGLGAGSGSAFSLLPAQNASGNWIKIVQRVPVRIALDPAELRAHPLRIGLSANVTVDTSNLTGPLVAGSASPAGGVEQGDQENGDVDGRIRRIIAANMGAAGARAR